jgi:hypothetical protein
MAEANIYLDNMLAVLNVQERRMMYRGNAVRMFPELKIHA